MRRVAFWWVALLVAIPGAVCAQEFSLFGVKFGATKAEVGKIWTELEAGKYHIKEAALFDVSCEFDHGERLYKITFSAPIGDKRPFALAATAFQNMVQRLWGQDGKYSVNSRMGKGAVETTVTDRKMMDEYIGFLELELSVLLRR